MAQGPHPENRLAETIRPLDALFDLIILDVPPGNWPEALSASIAARHLIVPVTAEYLAIESLAEFLRSYRELRLKHKGLATLLGIVLTMVDNRARVTREIVEILRNHNPEGVFRTEIPWELRAVEAPSHGEPLVRYAPRTPAAAAFRRLAAEMLRRLARHTRS